ncbi:MAG: hypothetical protein ABIF71_08590 [Planctomycetota bacterium]
MRCLPWLLTVLLCAGVLAAPALDNPVIRYFNGPTLSFAAVEKVNLVVQDYAGTAQARIWAEPEVQAFLAGLTGRIDAGLQKASLESGFDIPAIIAIVKRLEGGLGVNITEIDIPNEVVAGAFVMAGIPAGDRDAVVRYIGTLETIIARDAGGIFKEEPIGGRKVRVMDTGAAGKPVLCHVMDGTDLIVTLGRAAMEQCFQNAAQKEPAANLAEVLRSCGPGARGGLCAYADSARIFTMLREAVKEKEGEDSDEFRGLNGIALEDLSTVGLHVSIAKAGFHDRVFIGVIPAPRGIGRLFKFRVADTGLLKEVPAEAVAFSIANIDLLNLYDAIMAMAGAIMPADDFKQTQGMIAGLEIPLGVRIRDGLVASLAGDILFYQKLPVGIGMQMPELVLKLKLKDKGPLMAVLTNFVEPMVAQQGIMVESSQSGGAEVRSFPIPQLAMAGIVPTVAISADGLIIATTKAGAAAALAPQAAAITGNAEYTALEPFLATGTQSVSISFTDLKKGFSRLYGTLGMLLTMWPSAGRDLGLDLTKLPLTDTIAKHLFGSKSVSRQEGSGVFAEMYGPFDYLSGGAAIGIAAAILIPNAVKHRAGVAIGDDVGDMGGDAPAGTGPEVKLKQIH